MQQEKLVREWKEFNRRQFEAEQRVSETEIAESDRDRPFGGEAWKSDAVRASKLRWGAPKRAVVQSMKEKGKIEGEARGIKGVLKSCPGPAGEKL